MPDEWLLSVLSETFHCDLLTAAEQPLELALRVLELRSYAHAYQTVMNAKSRNDVQRTPMVEMVMDIEADVFKDRMQARMNQPT